MRFKLKLTIFIAIAGLCFSYWSGLGFATTGVIYLSPSSSSVQNGNDVTVSLRINPGTSVDSVQATIGYSQSSLQFVSSALGVFSTCAVNTGGGGAVQFACSKLGGSTNTDSLIANITFRALVGSGSTSLTVSNAEAAYAGSYTNPGSSGGTVSFTSPPAASTGGGSSGGSPSSSGGSHHSSVYYYNSSGSATPTPAASPTPSTPQPNPVKISASTGAIQFHSASIKLLLDLPAQAYIAYGTNKNELNTKTQQQNIGKSANIPISQLTPGTTYYYQAVATNSAGQVSKSSVGKFTTKGFSVSVTLLDSHYHPLIKKVVTLHSSPMYAVTNNKGVATFNNVPPGLHHISYSEGSHNFSQVVYVEDNVKTAKGHQTATPQAASAILTGYVQPVNHNLRPWIIVLTLILLATMFWMTRKTVRWRIKHLNRVAIKHLRQSRTFPHHA